MSYKKYYGKINIESIYSNNEEHRFILRRNYETNRRELDKSKTVFILINPSYSDELLFDKTNRLASNIGVRNNFNEVVILNLFSLVTKNTKELERNLQNANHKDNNMYIEQELRNADKVVISWGISNTFINRIEEVKQIIKDAEVDRNNIFSVYYT